MDEWKEKCNIIKNVKVKIRDRWDKEIVAFDLSEEKYHEGVFE